MRAQLRWGDGEACALDPSFDALSVLCRLRGGCTVIVVWRGELRTLVGGGGCCEGLQLPQGK
jgi:hypothetical protein